MLVHSIECSPNNKKLIYQDVIRPGRFNDYYLVDLPGPEDRQLILRKYLSPCTLSKDVPLDTLVNLTRSFTVAEVGFNTLHSLVREETHIYKANFFIYVIDILLI